jgi:penicillin-binding protein 1A
MPNSKAYPKLKPPTPRGVPKVRSHRIFGQLAFVVLVLLAIGVGALSGLVFVYSSDLPQVGELFDYRPDVMTEIYAANGSVIGSFALQRRVMVTYRQIPPTLREAIVSVEDRHFYSHFGVDILRIVRSAIIDMIEWRKAEGASTLTQQLSRRLFLTPQKSFRRKIREALLAIQIERHFTKDQIFTMYCNIIPWGAGSFGVGAAAERYFGKRLDQLTLPETAVLAGLPRNPTYYSPIRYPERALWRRNQVLGAMLNNGKISVAQYRSAIHTPLGLHLQKWNQETAPYFVDYVRSVLLEKYGAQEVNTGGLRVYTSLDPELQKFAVEALRSGLRADDRHRGWRGPEKNILRHRAPGVGEYLSLDSYDDPDWSRPITAGSRVHGLIMRVTPDYAVARFGEIRAHITPADFAWTKLTDPASVFSAGDLDLFHITAVKGYTAHATLDQYPTVQGAIIAIDNRTGEIEAMVGGYDYDRSPFNRAVEAERQVGSSFKPYVYSEALLQGLNPFDRLLDEPVSFGNWSPHDYDDRYEGVVTALRALAESRNVPAVRVLAHVGIDRVIRICRLFGITSRLVPDLPLALGASSLTLLEHTSAYTTFPDDGLHLEPRAILRVADYDGGDIDDFPPKVTEVLPAGADRVMISMLREVINSGTAVHARSLAVQYPIAGKTGTTNDFTDAWFIGFSPSITCGVWVGFDNHQTLGKGEEGSHVALPIWMDLMSHVLKGQPVQNFPDSPLLTNPNQVKEIMASAGSVGALAQNSPARTDPPVTPVAGRQTATEGNQKVVDTKQ